MNAINKFTSASLFSVALIAGVMAVSSAYQAPVNFNNDSTMQTVTIVAKRLSADEKIAYDQQATPAIQTVLITAKKLTTEEKIAMDKDALAIRQATAQSNRILRHSV